MTNFHLVQSDLVWEKIDANLERLEQRIIGIRSGNIILPEMYFYPTPIWVPQNGFKLEPALIKSLNNSRDLYDEIPPVTIRRIFLFLIELSIRVTFYLCECSPNHPKDRSNQYF